MPVPQPRRGSQAYLAALQGGIIGRLPVDDISKADRQRALEAEYRALEAAPGGQPVAWKGSDISAKWWPPHPIRWGSQNCRQYSHTIVFRQSDPDRARFGLPQPGRQLDAARLTAHAMRQSGLAAKRLKFRCGLSLMLE